MHFIFKAPFARSAELERLLKNIREGVSPCSVFGVSDASKPFMAALCSQRRKILYLTSTQEKATSAASDIEAYSGAPCVCLPPREQMLGVSSRSGELTYQTVSALFAIADGASATADISVLASTFMPPDEFLSLKRALAVGDDVRIDRLAATCVRLGYVRTDAVEAVGQFALRGGIFDIFPVGFEQPVRIEFFDTEIESIRVVDISTQRSVARLDRVTVLPARLFCPTALCAREAGESIGSAVRHAVRKLSGTPEAAARAESFSACAQRLIDGDTSSFDDSLSVFLKDRATLIDYLPEDTLIVLDEPKRLRERCENLFLEFSEIFKDLLGQGRALAPQGELVMTADKVLAHVTKRSSILALQGITTTNKDISPRAVFTLSGRNMQSFQNKPQMLAQELAAMKTKGYTTLLCCSSRARAKSLQGEISQYSVNINYTEDLSLIPAPECCYVLPVQLSHGFEFPELKVAVISDADIFAAVRQRTVRRAKHKGGVSINSFTELNVGDFVVHENNGIGVYQGIEKIVTDGVARDYITIAYAGTDRLYVPVEQLTMVQKYIGANEDIKPKLSKLGTKEWSSLKSKAKKSIEDITDQLIKIYSARQSAKGFAFSPDTPWQRQFEDDFPYAETPDQLTCIDQIKADMEKPKVMDRLLCGDVGYGKTEVALRAAFKAVMDSKQVAILAPTTVLAQQHYNTVLNRTEPYGVRCEVLSRFRTAAEQNKIKKKLIEGKVDIIVGTHALLAKTVHFKDLGLLIVDEEQRFGVKHKEMIKQLKSNVDVLTLSATPIPRTLHMSLVGIRDMSVLESPPQERYPVQTFVVEYNKIMIRDAIARELSRGGQVYVVSNRVQGIESVASELHSLVPEARIAIGHGQMEHGELEQVMLEFYNGQHDILLCTTIIESGLDVPNVNTIVVLDADNFGLSQLYQLRGRVGRSNRLAYAYFTFRRNKVLGEIAEKRLNALREFTEFGSGFKIAMRDLEIRGAGNLLGGEQSGHMQKIGYEMYCKLVREAVSGQTEEALPQVSAELKIEGYIDQTYISSQVQKLSLYKRIADIDSRLERDELLQEMTDRYGKPPVQVLNLLDISYLRSLAARAGVDRIRQKEERVVCYFTAGHSVDFSHVTRALSGFPKRAMLSAGGSLAIMINGKGLSDQALLSLCCLIFEKINE